MTLLKFFFLKQQIHQISLFYIILLRSGGVIWNTLGLLSCGPDAKVEHSNGLEWHDLMLAVISKAVIYYSLLCKLYTALLSVCTFQL